MTSERVRLTLINTQNITANSDVEVAGDDSNVIHVAFGNKTAQPVALAA